MPTAPHAKRLVLLAATVGWVALALQLYLILQARWASEASLLGGLINFLSFFTVQSNILVACVLTCAATGRASGLKAFFLRPGVSTAIAACITVVGVAYSLLLRDAWQPHGLQWLVSELMHDVLPLVYLGYWWCCVPKGQLRARQVLMWCGYPVLYFAYSMLRGRSIGVYQYPFINVDALGMAQVLLNALAVLLGFVLVALLLVALDRWRGRAGGSPRG